MRMNAAKRTIWIGALLIVAIAATLWLLFGKQPDETPVSAPPDGAALQTEADAPGEAAGEDGTDVNHELPEDGVAEGEGIKVNQVGYLSAFPKVAVVVGPDVGDEFHVRDADTLAVVYTGKLTEQRVDFASGDFVRLADFTGFVGEGRFVVQAVGAGRSFPFYIGPDIYRDTLVDLLRSYTLQRSGQELEDEVTGLTLKAGHERDDQAKLFFSDYLGAAGEPIDVSGGWYDAGDYGKYVPPTAIAAAQLLLAYELEPDAFFKGQMKFPASTQNPPVPDSEPDVLTETRIGLEWLKRMQRADGSVYHKVSGGAWPGFIPPVEDYQDRYVYGTSTFGTAQFAGVMAMAARIYKPHDPEFSAELLEHAVKAHAYLEQNPAASFRYDDGQDSGSGNYAKQTDKEERFWAAAELLRTTGEAGYGELLKQSYADMIVRQPQPVSWTDASALGQWAYYSSEQADDELKRQLTAAFVAEAEQLVDHLESDGYRNALKSGEYTWASVKAGAAKGNLLLLANRMMPDEHYVAAALDQLHHVLGRSATGYSYVTGIGSKFVTRPHHRIMAVTGKLLPGFVVGGPNEYGGDSEIDRIKQSLPPAKVYVDKLESFSSNEYAIDYNAPVVMLIAHFQ